MLRARIEGRVEHDDTPSRPHDATRLGESAGELLGVVQRRVEHDHVEARVAERDRLERRHDARDRRFARRGAQSVHVVIAHVERKCLGADERGAMREPAVPRAEIEHAERASGLHVRVPLRRTEHPALERLEASRAHRPLPRQRALGDVRQRQRIHRREAAPLGGAVRGVFLAEAAVEIGGRETHRDARRWVVGSGR